MAHLWNYIILAEDGGVYGTNDDEVAEKWSDDQGAGIIDRKLCTYEDQMIKEAPALDDEENDDDIPF